MIELKDFSFCYQGSNTSVLDQVNLSIQAGDWLVISGKSGCGKSTLALAIAGFLGKILPGETKGQILLDGINIDEMETYEISKKIYLVQQNPENQFCTLTVKDEIAFGLENRKFPAVEIEDRILSSLTALKAEDLMERRLIELSGGQQQKIAIATALALRPEILILDEPTSSLDKESLHSLLQSLSMLRTENKMGVVIIEHRVPDIRSLNALHFEMHSGRLFPGKVKVLPTYGDKTQQNTKSSPKSPSEILVQVKDLKVELGEYTVLDIDHLELRSGEIISLMGPNGSGKTTFLLSLLGMVNSKSVLREIIGHPTGIRLSRNQLAEIGLAFQNPDHQIFCDTVLDEIYYGPTNYGLEKTESDWIEGLISTFEFNELQKKHPYLLSFGQKGRLNLSSILSYKPHILLLDEVFIGQDLGNVLLILKTIRKYVDEHNSAAIIVNHLPDPVLGYADRLVYLDHGKKILDSDTDTAIKDYQQIFQWKHLEASNA
ncbi:MAG: ATP-binding cassette domain-containing protein [Chloroflexi bacterium]|nr:ATP-binding cassette domain-containing protein [Chloroflexota bacterium]